MHPADLEKESKERHGGKQKMGRLSPRNIDGQPRGGRVQLWSGNTGASQGASRGDPYEQLNREGNLG